MRYSLFAVAAASLAIAAPSAVKEVQANNVNTVDTTVANDSAFDINGLIEILDNGANIQFKGEMTQEEKDAMSQIEAIFAELRQNLEAIAQGQHSVSRRQLDLLSGLPIVGPLLGSLLGGGSGGGLGGLSLGGLGGILGRTRPEDLTVEEMDMMKEAEVLMEEFLREVAADNENNQQEQKNKVQRRQLDILFGLPIVGPLLQSLLGGSGLGGAVGGLTGTVGGLTGGLTGGATGGATGGLGGLTGGATDALGGLTGGLGGLTGGLTGSLGGLTGGLTGALPLGGLLGKNIEELHVSEEQMAKAREADAILSQLAEQIEAEGRAQEE